MLLPVCLDLSLYDTTGSTNCFIAPRGLDASNGISSVSAFRSNAGAYKDPRAATLDHNHGRQETQTEDNEKPSHNEKRARGVYVET